MAKPETRLGGFVAYATSRPTARAGAIRQAIGGDYKVEQDFYRRFRLAVDADRRGARNGSAIAAAVANANEHKAARFTALARRWPSVATRWDDCRHTEVERATINIAGLGLTLSPSFAELHPDGLLELVTMCYANKKYSASDIDMVLRVVQRAYEPLHPKATITFVDLPGRRIRTSAGKDLTRHDTRIETDAAGLAYALRNAA